MAVQLQVGFYRSAEVRGGGRVPSVPGGRPRLESKQHPFLLRDKASRSRALLTTCCTGPRGNRGRRRGLAGSRPPWGGRRAGGPTGPEPVGGCRSE